MKDKFDINGFFAEDKEKKRKKYALRKVITLREYLDIVKKDPTIAQNSQSRFLEIISFYGVDKLFGSKLFGIKKTILQIIAHIKEGAVGLSKGKQFLLLVGPTASGKSTIVNILKKALEEYREKPIYCIKGCRKFEEPLHLLPRSKMKEIGKSLGVKIEGDLCPSCRLRLKEKFTDKDGAIRLEDVPVEEFTFSIQDGRGIQSFEPSDDKTSDVTEIAGREDISISSIKGSNHPDSYAFGRVHFAERGMFDGIEIIKSDSKLLRIFITITEEKHIHAPNSNLPSISVDTFLIGHTNLHEYKKFSADMGNEALHDRIYVIKVPYPLKIKDEVAIYRKLIETESDFAKMNKCHIAPGTLEIAATFAIMTRIVESETGISLLDKMKVYNGDKSLNQMEDKEKRAIDIRHLVDEGQPDDILKCEGMFGMSSRDVLAALNSALMEESQTSGCLTPRRAIRALREVFEHRMGFTPEEIDRCKGMLSAEGENSVINEYHNLIEKIVTNAFVQGYEDLAEELFDKYINEAERYRGMHRKYLREETSETDCDDISGKLKEPDIKFLRSVESYIPISEEEADSFRGEIIEGKGAIPNFGYDTYSPLARAVEKKLISDSRAMLSIVLSTSSAKSDEEKRRYNDMAKFLIENGHCDYCANAVMKEAYEILSK